MTAIRQRHPAWAVLAAGAVTVLLLAYPARAQHWKNIPVDGVPLGADGKPDMSAPAPRTASGKPDLSGIYTPNYRYFQNLAADLGLEKVPMTDEARKIHAARATGLLGWEEPDAHCLPQGVPKINQAPVPFRIVQTDKLIVLVYGVAIPVTVGDVIVRLSETEVASAGIAQRPTIVKERMTPAERAGPP